MARLLETIEVDAAAVIGHSMGGFTAVELSINYPQLVECLVLVSPAGLSTYNDPRILRLLSQARRLERLTNSYGRMVAAHAAAAGAPAAAAALGAQHQGGRTRHPDLLPRSSAGVRARARHPGFVERD